VKFTCDSSVLVPALLGAHPRHEAALHAIRQRVTSLPGHVYLETFSVLTRLPAGLRVHPREAADALSRLGWTLLPATAGTYPRIVIGLVDADLRGGATYDGLVAAVAKNHGLTLITADTRARRTYSAIGVEVEFLDS